MADQLTPAEEFRDAARIVREYAGKATSGPWLALFAEPDGETLPDREPGWPGEDDDDRDPGFLSLLAGTALPDKDGSRPVSYQASHLLAEHDDDLFPSEAAELYGSLRWAALLCPLIAEPLAALLDAAAEDAAGAEGLHPALVPHARWQKPLALARLIRSQHQAMQGGEHGG